MRYIEKGKGPDCLEGIASDMPWDEFGGVCKNELVHCLYVEQVGMCVYCERQLEGSENQSVRVEHMIPQGRLSEELSRAIQQAGMFGMGIEIESRRYAYENIVLSCFGYPPPSKNHELADPDNISCDQHKGQVLSL